MCYTTKSRLDVQFVTQKVFSHQRCSIQKGVLRNFTKFTKKHLCQIFFFYKVAGLACNFFKKETLTQVFSCKVCEISKNTFFTEHARATASVVKKIPLEMKKGMIKIMVFMLNFPFICYLSRICN